MARLKREVSIHLEKARESAMLAVETYNRPRTAFRSGGYIVFMVIAWTALFHSIFLHRGEKPFYRRKKNRRHFEMLDGDRKAWELATCAAQFWGDQHPPARLNLDFFTKLRNKIEHRSMPGLDLDIFGECQALLFNFEELLVEEFGEKHAINESLSLALQFSCSRSEQQERSIRKLHKSLAKDIRQYVDTFRSSLTIEQMDDLRFSYKVFLIPKPANRQAGSDLAVEFIKYDRNNPDDTQRVNRAIALIKPSAADRIHLKAEIGDEGNSVPFRLVNDESAPAVRAMNPDLTHPYRQKDLLALLIRRVPAGMKVTTHDLQCVRESFNVKDNPNYFFKSRFGSGQYSKSYLEWLVAEVALDLYFFSKSKARHAELKTPKASVSPVAENLDFGNTLNFPDAGDTPHVDR